MNLIDAVKFISNAQRKAGDEAATHCILRYGYAVASDGVLAAGCPIQEADLNCCPQTDMLRLALDRCVDTCSITQSADSLFIRSGEFSAYVPLADPSRLAVAVPDAGVAPLNEEFRTAVRVCGSLVKDSATTLLQSCIELGTGYTISTNGYVILQYWHGCDMPPSLLVPKRFADALNKIKKPLASFGFSEETFTVWFDDRSWLRTSIYQERIPDMVSKLVKVKQSWPIPAEFFEQASVVAKFSEDGDLYLSDGVIRSHSPESQNIGCYRSYSLGNIPDNVIYNAASLALVAKYATHFSTDPDRMTMIYGERIRGAIAHRFIVKPSSGLTQVQADYLAAVERNNSPCSLCGGDGMHNGEICDCEIPF